MTYSTMAQFTSTQLMNPSTVEGFIHARCLDVGTLLSAPQTLSGDAVELVCLAGLIEEVWTAYEGICREHIQSLGSEHCVASVQASLLHFSPSHVEVLWKLLNYLHLECGDTSEVASLSWLLRSEV